MTEEERKLALYCLKANSDYHSEVCEECVNYPNCDHTIQDDVTETIIKALEQEPKMGYWKEVNYRAYKALCSNCGTWSPIMGNYCPYCGAKMGSEE